MGEAKKIQWGLLVQHALLGALVFGVTTLLIGALLVKLSYRNGYDYPVMFNIIAFVVGGVGAAMMCFILKKKKKEYVIPVLGGAFGFAVGSFFFALGGLGSSSPFDVFFLFMIAGYISSYSLGIVFEEKKRSVVIGAIGSLGVLVGTGLLTLIYVFFHDSAAAFVDSIEIFNQENIWVLKAVFFTSSAGFALGALFSYYFQKDKQKVVSGGK